MLSCKLFQLNRIIFSIRLQSNLPNRNAAFASNPQSFRNLGKQNQQSIDRRQVLQQRPPILLNANKRLNEARQPPILSFWNTDKRQQIEVQQIQAKSSNKSTIYLDDRMLELTIGNRFEEPLLNIDEYNFKPSINDDPHEKSVLEKNGFIHMPVKQARLLIQRIYKLSEIKFQIDKSLTLLSMDRWTETPLENGLLQQLYTYKIPGMLFGDYQQTFYLSVLQFKVF
uniref:Uncharacterized protein n=1 Tax=Meloidogyne incognita TaxID=6306 RepID=A0A914LP49_MELIC